MSDAFQCDRCNEYVDGIPSVRTSNWTDVDAELCDGCAKAFKTWLRNGGDA